MPEYLADQVEAVAARYADRGEAVPKVVNAEIVRPNRCPDALSRFLNSNEMSVAAIGGDNIRAISPLLGSSTSRAAVAVWCGPVERRPRRWQRSLGRSSESVTSSQPAEILGSACFLKVTLAFYVSRL
jgi:hypothetical protein